MTTDRDAALFVRMPEPAVAALRAIMEDPRGEPSTLAAEALAAVEYPRKDQLIADEVARRDARCERSFESLVVAVRACAEVS